MAAPVAGYQDELDMDENGIMRGPDGSDFILDENGILRAAPNGRDSGINSVTPTAVPPSYRPGLDDFDDSVRVEIATPSSASGSNRGGDQSYSDRSQEVDDWPALAQQPIGILKRRTQADTKQQQQQQRQRQQQRGASPPLTQLTQDIDYCGPVPNNTQELFQTPVHSNQNSQSSADNKEETNQILDAQLEQQKQQQQQQDQQLYGSKSSSSETQEEREDLLDSTTLRYSDVLQDTERQHQQQQQQQQQQQATAADISLSDDDDVGQLDLNDLERYAELEIQNGRDFLSNESQKTPATLPTIYLESDHQDQYIFRDDSREIDRSGSSLHLPDVTNENLNVTMMDEEMPVFTGASIPFGESCDEMVGSDAIIQQHLRDAIATKDDQGLMTQHADIPHSLIEFEALEVQMQIQSQLAQLKEEEDVLGDFLQSTEQNEQGLNEVESPNLARGDSLPFENTRDSDDLKATGTASGSPSRIPVSKRRSLTKGGSLRSSTDSLNSNATAASKIPARKASPGVNRGRSTPQKKDNTKENRRPDFRRSSLNLKQPRSESSTPLGSRATSSASGTRKGGGPRPLKARHGVPQLDLTDSMDDSDIEKVRTKLRSKLATEQTKRVQQLDVIKQLQEDYDQLLTKFALAEVTIDQLRLGAKMNLYSDSPTPQTVGQVQQSQHAQLAQPLTFGYRGQGQAGFMGGGRLRGQQGVQGEFQGSRPHSRGSFSGLTPLSFQDYDEPARFQDDVGGTKGESIKIGLLFQARSLSDQMESFQMLLDEDELNHEEQEKVIDKVKVDYDKLQSDYRQAKHDSQLMKQHNLLDQENADSEFDSEKVIEGELFRLGMKLDDLQQNVEENMRIAKRRTPFQDLARPPHGGRHVTNGYGNSRPIDESSTTDLEGDPLDTKWQKLQKDYNALLALFDRMKRLPKTPERDRDIAALMKKLKYLHGQSPNLLQPLPSLPESDDDTLEGSLFGSTSSVVRATPKNSVVAPDHRDPTAARSDRRRSQSRDSSSPQKSSDLRRRSRSSFHDDESDGVVVGRNDDRPPKGPRPSSSSGRGDDRSASSKKDQQQSDKESTHSRGRRSGKKSGLDKGDGKTTEGPQHKASIRPIELDRDSGFIGSESSRHSQSNVSKRAHNMSTLTDEDESAQFPYKPSAIPAHLSSAPPPNTWTDSELSSAMEKPPARGHRSQKRSTTSLVSESTGRPRKSSRNAEQLHRRGRAREESETEGFSTGRASVKSEKIKSLESEMEKLKELIQSRQAEKQMTDDTQAAHVANGNREQEAWQRGSYPWIDEQHRRYTGPDGGKVRQIELGEYPGQTWEDYPYHARRRHSLVESDIPSIDTLEPDQSQPRRRSMTPDRRSYERRLADKNRYNEREAPRVPRPRDLDREGERREEELAGSRGRRTANRQPRSRSVPRRLDYETDDSPAHKSRGFHLELRRDAEKAYGRRPRDRYQSLDNLSDGYHGYEPSNEEFGPSSPEMEPYAREHEKHYRFFRDLEKGRQHIQKVLDSATENRRKKEERERKEKRRQPVIVQGPGTLTKTVTECCPMCKGKGQCTHTQVYHMPQGPGHLGMGFAGMSQIPVSNGDIGASVEQNLARGAQPVPGMQPPGGFVPNFAPMPNGVGMATTGPVPMAPAYAQPYAPVTPQQAYAPVAPPAQQPMTSTPYAGGDVRPLESEENGPVIKIPLRLYENRLNTKYMVKEYSDDARSVQSGDRTRTAKKSKPRSSSLPRDSTRSRKSSKYTDNDSMISEKYQQTRGTEFNDSLDEAVRLAVDLKRLSGKMKNEVKDDLRRSVRTEHTWKTTTTTTSGN